jgi:hypothetical protein
METRKPSATGVRARRRFPRLVWLAAGVAVSAFAIFEVVVHDLGPVPILVFAVLPDVALLAGADQRHPRRQLPPRAITAYNLTHGLVIPLSLIGMALAGLLAARVLNEPGDKLEAARRVPLLAYVAGLTWFAHIAVDRALGFGVRKPDDWQRDSRSSRD